MTPELPRRGPCHDYLRRLQPQTYRGLAAVHWTMSINGRRTGWLDAAHHAHVRELLTHAAGRYGLSCPAYCLMPDHAHFLWLGENDASDQRLAARYFRRHWTAALDRAGFALQTQGHDHVLRPAERKRGAFRAVAHYILANPERAKLVERWEDYSFSGAVIFGRPELDPRQNEYWEKFWRRWVAQVDGDNGEQHKPDAATALEHEP